MFMNLANGEISVDEVERLYTIIRSHFQKEHNSICLGLEVLLTNIREWYKDNMNIAERLLNGEGVTYGYFFKYTHKDERASAARESLRFIENVLKPYEEKKLSHKYLSNTLWGNLIAAIGGLQSDSYEKGMFGFIGKSISPKKLWLLQSSGRDYIVVKRDEVEWWILGLKELKERIEEIVSDLQTQLKCDPSRDQNLVERIRAQIQR